MSLLSISRLSLTTPVNHVRNLHLTAAVNKVQAGRYKVDIINKLILVGFLPILVPSAHQNVGDTYRNNQN